jgi:hypothetical protein
MPLSGVPLRARGASWAWAISSVPPQPFSIFFEKGFSFSSFEIDLFYFCNKTGTI